VDGPGSLRETPGFDNFHEIIELAVLHPAPPQPL
jgi:hypothetical protein